MGYVFDVATLQSVAQRAIGLPHAEMVDTVVTGLARHYPRHVETRQDWVLSLAGGALGIMTVLHGSLSEYVAIFGTPIGTEGFSGRYWIDVYDVVLAGEMWTYTEDDFRERRVFRPGDLAHLRRRQAKGFRFPEACWLLEYGRGPVATALPFALGDAFLALDAKTIAKTLWIYGRLVVRELAHGKV
ncbi:MAG: ERG2 family protein [Candidatus Rokuibacteriota bacterium]